MANQPSNTTLEPAIAVALLDKLSTDDTFREMFQKNPQAALQAIGHPETTGAATCLSKVSGLSLASKEILAASRDELFDLLTNSLSLQPHKLCTIPPSKSLSDK